MLATFAALALALPADSPSYTVEFRVLRVPAGRWVHQIVANTNGVRSLAFPAGMDQQVLSGDSSLVDISIDVYRPARSSASALGGSSLHFSSYDSSLIDAGGLPGSDARQAPPYAPLGKKAELSGPKLRAGRTPMTERLTLPQWDIVTPFDERRVFGSDSSASSNYSEVLVSHATFTASAVPAADGRIELRVSYAEGELPPAKEPTPALSPDLAPFYAADAPAPQPITQTFRPPSVENKTIKATANATLLPGQMLVFFVGQCTSRPTQPWLTSRADNLHHWWQAIEDDVIVLATVRN